MEFRKEPRDICWLSQAQDYVSPVSPAKRLRVVVVLDVTTVVIVAAASVILKIG